MLQITWWSFNAPLDFKRIFFTLIAYKKLNKQANLQHTLFLCVFHCLRFDSVFMAVWCFLFLMLKLFDSPWNTIWWALDGVKANRQKTKLQHFFLLFFLHKRHESTRGIAGEGGKNAFVGKADIPWHCLSKVDSNILPPALLHACLQRKHFDWKFKTQICRLQRGKLIFRSDFKSWRIIAWKQIDDVKLFDNLILCLCSEEDAMLADNRWHHSFPSPNPAGFISSSSSSLSLHRLGAFYENFIYWLVVRSLIGKLQFSLNSQCVRRTSASSRSRWTVPDWEQTSPIHRRYLLPHPPRPTIRHRRCCKETLFHSRLFAISRVY